MRVLLVAHASVGHLTGLLTIGRHLRSSGLDVRLAMPAAKLPKWLPLPSMVATAMTLPPLVAAAGITLVPLTPRPSLVAMGALMPWLSGPRELALGARMTTAGGVALAAELEAELDRAPADVLVIDFAFLPAAFVAERRRLPLAVLYHAGLPFPVDGVYPYTEGAAFSRAIDDRVGELRRRLGLPPRAPGLFERPYSPDLNLLATTPELEGRPREPSSAVVWVGPCVDGRQEATAATVPLDRLRPEAIKVYVSLGTVFNGSPGRFRALIDGLTGPGVQLIVSAGPSTDALRSLASDDVLLFPFVPQLAVLQAVDLVVSHGGNNTVNEALLAGRPLLVMPVGGEQEANARRVERLGVGLVLPRQGLTPAVVRRAFDRLRSDPGYRARARAISSAASGAGGAAEAARQIRALAERRRTAAP